MTKPGTNSMKPMLTFTPSTASIFSLSWRKAAHGKY